MPLPTWLARVNKSVFNPMALHGSRGPVLRHVGRSSGTIYRTPLDVHSVEGGRVVVLMYGSRSDWVRNVLAAGGAVLEEDGREFPLVTPRVISREAARRILPPSITPPPRLLRVTEYLHMDLGPTPATASPAP